MKEFITVEQAVDKIQDGDTLLIGGFLGTGTPEPIIDALVKTDKKNFTLVNNDTGFVDKGVGKMVVNKQFKKIITSHIGTNKETGRQMIEGETEVVLTPQGTLAEAVRSGAYGLGGVLTKTGIGTEAAKGLEVITVDGEEYLLHPAIKGDVSIILADVADTMGNLKFRATTRNFNLPMCGASTITIVYARKVVEAGELDPDDIHVPGVLVDYVIDGGKN